jgi:hypothetical protein
LELWLPSRVSSPELQMSCLACKLLSTLARLVVMRFIKLFMVKNLLQQLSVHPTNVSRTTSRDSSICRSSNLNS